MIQKLVNNAKRMWFRTWGLFPQELPRSLPAFEAYCNRIMFAYEIPSRRSYQSTVATMIMHLDQAQSTIPPRKLVHRIRKAMANNVAYDRIEYFRDLDRKEAELAVSLANGKDAHESKPSISIESSPAGMVQ